MLARLRQDMHTFCAVADILEAFDTSCVEATLIRLHEVMWSTVASFLCGTLSQVGVFGDVPPPWVDKGIAEGRLLSPLLFYSTALQRPSDALHLVSESFHTQISVSRVSFTPMTS